MTMPNATYTLDTHRFEYEDISVLFENFYEDSRSGIRVDATVETSRFPKAGLLHQGLLYLVGSQSKQTFVRALEHRRGNGFLDDVDFDGIIAQTCALSYRRWKQGYPAVQLSSLEPSARSQWLLYPYLQEWAVCVLFGDGESGKSTLSEAIGLSVATGERVIGYDPAYSTGVLYLDWETEAETHREILAALARGHGVSMPENVWYRRMHTTLAAGIGAIRQEVAIHDTHLIIVDSIGLAGGDEPERAGTKIAMFNALRTLQECTVLAIDHVAHADKSRPYGSVYTRNIARVVWGVTKDQDNTDEDTLRIALRREKLNRGKSVTRQGFTMEFANDTDGIARSIHLSRADPMDIPSFEKKAPLYTRLIHELRRGALTSQALAESLDAKRDSVQKTLNRNKNIFIHMEDETWGLRT